MILMSLLGIVFVCIIIWRASNGFGQAANYLGRNLSDGVKGATINAIGSSVPEFLTTIFFLFVLKGSDGFAGGIATTAGSAVFNSMIIPGVVILVVTTLAASTNIREFAVSRKVLWRDGVALLIAEFSLIVIVTTKELYWWHGLFLIGVYAAYIVYTFRTMSQSGQNHADEFSPNDKSLIHNLLTLDLAQVFIKDRINKTRAWILLVMATSVMSAACFLLVKACVEIGIGLGLPIYFIAVVLASAATSVPDTLISVRDARKGNYDDAVSNALGSNIFDISFSLGFPLLMYTLFFGSIVMNPATVTNIGELWVLLLILTAATIVTLVAGRRITSTKGFILLGIYGLFIAYVLGRSLDSSIAAGVAEILNGILAAISI